MIQKIDTWLRNQKRDYAFGLSVFNQFANPDMKKNYGEFLSAGLEAEATSSHFPMLINKVTAIYNKLKADPKQYADMQLPPALLPASQQVKQLIALKTKTEELEEKVTELESSDEDKTAELEELQEELDEKNNEIDELKASLADRGVKVLDSADLPPTIKAKYERIKAIVPLMAAVHGELKNDALTDEQRKVLAEELCTLDNERHCLWDDIDTYLNSTGRVLTEEKKTVYSDDPVIRGMQIADRMKRVKENLKRAKEAIITHQKKDKEALAASAQERVLACEAEMDELNAMLNDKK